MPLLPILFCLLTGLRLAEVLDDEEEKNAINDATDGDDSCSGSGSGSDCDCVEVDDNDGENDDAATVSAVFEDDTVAADVDVSRFACEIASGLSCGVTMTIVFPEVTFVVVVALLVELAALFVVLAVLEGNLLFWLPLERLSGDGP